MYAWGFFNLASQPGLEPGTYGLTENSASQNAMFHGVYSFKYLDVQ